EYLPQSRIHYEKNPNYTLPDAPNIDGIVVLTDLNTEAALSAYRSEQLAWHTVQPAQLDSVKRALPEATFVENSGCCSPAIFLRVDQAPGDDIRVRQAVSMSLDREAWGQALFKGYAEAPYSCFTSHWTDYFLAPENMSD